MCVYIYSVLYKVVLLILYSHYIYIYIKNGFTGRFKNVTLS